MLRMTKATGKENAYTIEASLVELAGLSCSGPAIDRLARFENAYDSLRARQETIATDLEQLRSQGRTHSVSFKQLLAEKLMNQSILVLFRSHGLE
ncbi:MAG: hypothetical protein EOM08_07400 [Clostridia bacterium]|nr:hypothetical protein [Clostridia bacterium]